MWILYGFEDIGFDLWFFYSREPLKTFSLKTDFLFYVDLEFPLYKQTSTTSICHTHNSKYMRILLFHFIPPCNIPLTPRTYNSIFINKLRLLRPVILLTHHICVILYAKWTSITSTVMPHRNTPMTPCTQNCIFINKLRLLRRFILPTLHTCVFSFKKITSITSTVLLLPTPSISSRTYIIIFLN